MSVWLCRRPDRALTRRRSATTTRSASSFTSTPRPTTDVRPETEYCHACKRNVKLCFSHHAVDFTYTEFSCDDSDDDVDEYCLDDSSNAVADIFISLFGVIISSFYLHTNTVHDISPTVFSFLFSSAISTRSRTAPATTQTSATTTTFPVAPLTSLPQRSSLSQRSSWRLSLESTSTN